MYYIFFQVWISVQGNIFWYSEQILFHLLSYCIINKSVIWQRSWFLISLASSRFCRKENISLDYNLIDEKRGCRSYRFSEFFSIFLHFRLDFGSFMSRVYLLGGYVLCGWFGNVFEMLNYGDCFGLQVENHHQSNPGFTPTFDNWLFSSWTDLICLFNISFLEKFMSQILHWKGFFFHELIQYVYSIYIFLKISCHTFCIWMIYCEQIPYVF